MARASVRLLAQRRRLCCGKIFPAAEASPDSGYWLHLYMGQGSGGKACPRGHVLTAALGWLFYKRLIP